ncbi:glycosyltransferase [Salinibacterium sp. SWN1162]|uniref:glycosyltransferase n=1 Tax=Salinibacterium sp. SWN1162 TaxID=2792053 RepID=UPI0018CD9F1C|nr:glycosyltransferase [Salinibacterium sp. SWN1162]MBH0009328.1 glycosyltransferase [Salinibacterium sp. SWN1162]
MHIAHVTSFFAAAPVGPSSAVRSRGLAYRAAGHEFSVIVPGKEASVTRAEFGTVITVPARGRALARGFVPIAKAVRRALASLVPDQIEVADRLSAREIGSWAKLHRVPAIYLIDTSSNDAAHLHNIDGYDRVVSVAPLDHYRDSRASPLEPSERSAKEPANASPPDDEFLRAPAGINLEIFSPLRHSSSLRDSSDANLVILCATPLTLAGLPALAIDLVKRRSAKGEDVHLVILGDGPLRGRLERSAVGLPVQFLGAHDLTLTERAEVFATADIAVVTLGNHEGHAVALESLASGTPVVTTSACGPSLTFVDGGGLCVEPDLNQIEGAIRALEVQPVENRRNAARSSSLIHDCAASERDLLALHESLHSSLPRNAR